MHGLPITCGGYPQYDFEMPEYLGFFFPLEIDQEIEWWPYSTQGYFGGQYDRHTIADELEAYEEGSVRERWQHQGCHRLRWHTDQFCPEESAVYKTGDLDDDYPILLLWLILHSCWRDDYSQDKVDEDLYRNIEATVNDYETCNGLRSSYWTWGKQSSCRGEVADHGVGLSINFVGLWHRLVQCMFATVNIPKRPRLLYRQSKVRKPKPKPLKLKVRLTD